MVVLFLISLRNCHTVFHSGCTHLNSHQQCTSLWFSPHSCQQLFLVYLTITIPTDIRWAWFAFPWWLVMLSTFSHTDWPSVCLLGGKCLFTCIQILCQFFNRIVFAIEFLKCFLYFGYYPLIRYITGKYFLSFICCYLILSMDSFAVQRLIGVCVCVCVFSFIFTFVAFVFGIKSKKICQLKKYVCVYLFHPFTFDLSMSLCLSKFLADILPLCFVTCSVNLCFLICGFRSFFKINYLFFITVDIQYYTSFRCAA